MLGCNANSHTANKLSAIVQCHWIFNNYGLSLRGKTCNELTRGTFDCMSPGRIHEKESTASAIEMSRRVRHKTAKSATNVVRTIRIHEKCSTTTTIELALLMLMLLLLLSGVRDQRSGHWRSRCSTLYCVSVILPARPTDNLFSLNLGFLPARPQPSKPPPPPRHEIPWNVKFLSAEKTRRTYTSIPDVVRYGSLHLRPPSDRCFHRS